MAAFLLSTFSDDTIELGVGGAETVGIVVVNDPLHDLVGNNDNLVGFAFTSCLSGVDGNGFSALESDSICSKV
jgi:hypothetical protein